MTLTPPAGSRRPSSHAARARRARLEQPLPDHHARPRAHPRGLARGASSREPSVDVQAVLDHAEGLVCLTGCAERSVIGRGARADERDGPAAARRVRPGGPVRRAAAPLRAPRPRPQPRARGARPAAGGGCVATGDVHAHARARAELQDAFVALRQPRHARRLRAAAARQPQPRDEHAAGDGQPLRRPSRGGPRDAAAGRAADVRPDARTSATAIPAPRSRAPRGAWPSCAAHACDERYGAGAPAAARGRRARGAARAWSRSCA